MKVLARSLATILVALSVLLAAPAARADEARNKEIAATLKKGRDLIERGRDGEARALLTPLIADPSTPAELMALAFFFRGVANDRLKRPEEALADLGNAIWFDNLPEALRAQAHVRRASSLMQLGRVAEAKQDAEAAHALAPGDATIAQAVEAIRRAPDEKAAVQAQTSQITKNEERITQLPDPAPAVSPAMSESTAALPADGAKAAGFAIQLGAIGNKATAQNEWQRIAAAHGDLLAGLEARYLQRGNLTKLQAGPLPSYQASVELCGKLQQRGQDCFAVTP